ncbi:MAG: N,N'-diacetylchitobiose phosphorylase [Spirochaetaceae bacterium]|jgi:N,N'-diacetylchitobiose phosphorylase|nr:N,N'-diacetylchitobiose phosphorylase [Spirochaetaceae bacterium]
MNYGHFDNERREYVIDRVDVPVSWTNYIGVNDMCGVFNHTAGGYLFYKSPEYHRISRFRANGVPMDRPGHYVYIRDNESGEYWSISWQPVAKPLDQARYSCRHGLSYTTYRCEYQGIVGEQTLFIPIGEPVELWDVSIKNNSQKARSLSIFSYVEFSYHNIRMDNQNFQMSLYSCGSSFADGVIEMDPFYEEGGRQFFTASGTENDNSPENFDCLRDRFIGPYRSEANPLAVEKGVCSGSFELGGNHCGGLRRKVTLAKGESARIVFMLGEGDRAAGRACRKSYASFAAVDAAKEQLAAFWQAKLDKLQINTPHQAMNTMINIWTLYQSEINVMFSRFASFIEVGGRTGLGYRDTAQDAMCIQHSNPEKCRSRIVELLKGLTSFGYGLHLFQPEWFEEKKEPEFKSPTVVPTPDKSTMIHGLKDACADDALWLVPSIVEYIRETGDLAFVNKVLSYADGGTGTVYEHMTKILDFSAEQVGKTGICKGLRADWNDCLNLGGGESAMVSFLHHWALGHFLALALKLGRTEDLNKYGAVQKKVRAVCEKELWNGEWYTRGITASGRKIGTPDNTEGKVFMESNTWAVISGVASPEHGEKAMDAVDAYLYTPWGLMLCAPAYSEPDDEIGFVTRVYKGLKENAAIFSHPNPWAWAAEALLGRGERAMKFYDALCPYLQNDKIEIRESEPYSYCQFIVGADHKAFGRAHHPFMTGSAGWSYFSATRYILGIRPDFDRLIVDPCIPPSWKGFSVTRVWRGATYRITVDNTASVSKGVKEYRINGNVVEEGIPAQESGTINTVDVVMG